MFLYQFYIFALLIIIYILIEEQNLLTYCWLMLKLLYINFRTKMLLVKLYTRMRIDRFFLNRQLKKKR